MATYEEKYIQIPVTLSTGEIKDWLYCNTYIKVAPNASSTAYNVTVQIKQVSTEYMEWSGNTSINVTCNGVTKTTTQYVSLYGSGVEGEWSTPITWEFAAPSSGTVLTFDILVDLRGITGSYGGQGPSYEGRPGVNFWYYSGSTQISIEGMPLTRKPSVTAITASPVYILSANITATGVDFGNPKAKAQYRLKQGSNSWGSWSAEFDLAGDGKFTLMGLSSYTQYQIEFKLTNSAGSSNTVSTTFTTLGTLGSIGTMSNGNPYNSNSGISASDTSITVNLSSVNYGNPAGRLYWTCSTGGTTVKSGNFTSGTTISVTGLNPYTSYKITAYVTNSVGTTESKSITIRTRQKTPALTLTFVSAGLESLTFKWTSDITLSSATQYRIGSGSWVDLNQSGRSGTFTTPNSLTPNTSYTINVRGWSSIDTVISAVASATGTTLDITRITSVSGQIFGVKFGSIEINNPSGNTSQLDIWTEGNGLTPKFTISANLKGKNNYEFTPTQEQWDSIYKCFANSGDINLLPLYFQVTTYGESKTYLDTIQNKSLTLTGIAKTAHIKDGGTVKRCECWIKVNGENKRAVAWIKVNGEIRRCI